MSRKMVRNIANEVTLNLPVNKLRKPHYVKADFST